MPAIVHAGGFTNTSEAIYVLVASYQDNNSFTVSYFDGSGNELTGAAHVLNKGQSIQLPLDRSQMRPTKPGEIAEWKAAHIHSRYPVSVQFYSDGSSAGGMYQAIPVSALGKKYVAAAWVDNPLRNNPGYINRDSSSSEFMIIAPYDNTVVTFVPNSTTYSGVIGCNTGAGATGQPHPVTITLARGQVYWVRSNPQDISDDMSGSTIVSSKPIAVLAGQERALFGDPTGYWTTLDNDIRDLMIEQMTPVEDWGTDYPSIPCMPATAVSDVTVSGDGDMYRMFTNDPKGLFMDMWLDGTPPTSYPSGLSLYQAPAAAFDNVLDPVDLLSRTKDSTGSLKKFYALQYQYFQGHHDFDPNRIQKGSKGANPQDEESARSSNEMNLVPIDRWRLSTVFCVPKNTFYRGYQFVNIITSADSLNKIMVSVNNKTPTSIKSMLPIKQYTIPLHPDLAGVTLKLPAGTYIITGNTPFVCYSYGRTETVYKDIWGYAAPTGQAYGSRTETNPPRADVIPNCTYWDVRVYDSRPGDEGIADIMLLQDPDGFYARPPRVSYNCRLNPTDPQFTPGDTSVSFQVQVADPTKDAYAAIYVVDRAGNDTVIELHYKAQQVDVSSQLVHFDSVDVGREVCSTFTVHVKSTGNTPSVLVPNPSFQGIDQANTFSFSTVPSLPATMHVGDSIIFTMCFKSTDTMLHIDTLRMLLGCGVGAVAVRGYAVTPIIIADDYDFQTVPVGDTQCHGIRVRNVGNGKLILDSTWLLHLNPHFTFKDAARIPDTIWQGQMQTLTFCFHPDSVGKTNTRMDWGTNLSQYFAHDWKDTSYLVGNAVKPGLNWDRPTQQFTVVCDRNEIDTVYLENSGSAPITVDSIHVLGPDAAEFSILGTQSGSLGGWQLANETRQWVVVQFKPDLSKGYADRHCELVAYGSQQSVGNGLYTDTLRCTGIIRHSIVAFTPPSFNFGQQTPGNPVDEIFTVTNTGDTDFVYSYFDLPNPDFTVLSGPAIGSHLKPGATDTIVVQYMPPANGGSGSTVLTIGNPDSACGVPKALIAASAAYAQVLGSGHQYPVTYMCQNGTYTIVASSAKATTEDVMLDSVMITGGDASQFVFANDNSRLKVVNQPIHPGDSLTFPVLYTPTKRGPVNANVVYYFFDPVKDSEMIVTNTLSGFGYQAANTVSAANPGTANGTYQAVTANNVSIPVHLTTTFTDTANVYGIKFTLRYVRDVFRFLSGGTTAATGLTLVNNPQPMVDPTDNHYELLPIQLGSTTPITNVSTIANVTMQYMVAKDTTSMIQVKDLQFLGNNGSPVCWVAQDTIPGTFVGQDVCGNPTLRNYLNGGNPSFSIDRIVPNPVSQSASIGFLVYKNNTPVTIEVFNALGDKVQTLMKNEVHAKGGYEVDLDATNLPSGLYTVFISTDGYGSSKQLIISK